MIKRNYFCSLWLLMILLVNFVLAQPSKVTELKQYADKTLGGECILLSSSLSVENETSMKTFEIEVPVDGEYYLSAWVMNTGIIQKENGLKLFIDNQKSSAGNVYPQKEGWQSSKLLNNDNAKNEKLKLSSGKHYLTFCTTVPEVPPVDFIRLSKTESGSEISEAKWINYIETAKENVLPPNYAEIKSDSTNNAKLFRTLSNPEGDYLHQIEVGFTYTYYTQLYFYAGSSVVLETKMPDPYASDPVMHFFNADDPVNRGSWGDDDGGDGNQAKISCTVQYTGYYYVLVRSFWPSTIQTTNLYLFDNLYASNVVVAGTGFRCDHTLTNELNYFTSFLSGDSRLWVESYETGLNGRILGYNDDYSGSGDFSWGNNARVKKSYPQRMWNCFVTRNSSNNPSGQCDLYMRCKNSDITPWFENLEQDDAIMSAPSSGTYNCISWSGGVTTYWAWPPSQVPWSNPNGTTPALTAFDNYYSNKNYLGQSYPRYSGAWNYTRSGATSSNNQVDLWSISGSYTHGSVNARWSDIGNPGNGHPHGYDWESKPGSLARTFHPRYALSGSAYGNVDKYYIWDGTVSGNREGVPTQEPGEGMSLAKSIASGLTVLGAIDLTDNEKSRLESMIEELPASTKQEFNKKYFSWKATWSYPEISIHSNPAMYAQSDQYKEFIQYCKEQGKSIWPLLFKNYIEGSYFDILPIKELVYPGNLKLLEDLGNEYIKPKYTETGIYIAPSPRAFDLLFIKELLELPKESWGENANTPEGELDKASTTGDKFTLEQNYPNPFNPLTQIRFGVPEDAWITMKIYDILGKEVAVLINNEFRNAGWHSVIWDSKDLNGSPVSSGIYFCRLVSNEHVKTIKLILVK